MKKIRNIGCLLLLLWLAVWTKPLQATRIEGTALFAKNKTLRLYTYDDMLSRNRELLTVAEVDGNGLFSVNLPNIREITMLTFAYNLTYGSFYVEPNRSYVVDLYTDSTLINRVDAEMLGNYIQITVLNNDSTELNWKINYFDQYYTYFMYYNGTAIMRHAPKEIYDSLLQVIESRFPVPDQPVDFYDVYVKYRIGIMESMYYDKSKSKIYHKYLETPYVYYNNPAYMDFIGLFFEDYLYSGSKKITKGILYQDINELNNYAKLLDDLGKDPLLQNEIIREIVLIKGLGELKAYPEEFKKGNLESLLNALSQKTKFKEHRMLATNQLKSFQLMNPQGKLIPFTLTDEKGNEVTSSQFAGKYLYIQFFATYCQDCIREMLILKYLKSQFGDKVQFLSVMLDFEPMKLYHFVKDYPDFDWQFAKIDGNCEFLEQYHLYTLPLGLLADPDGRIVAFPAPSASDGLGELFQKIFLINRK